MRIDIFVGIILFQFILYLTKVNVANVIKPL